MNTGRCLKTVPCGGVIRSVVWCPNQAISLIAVAADKKVLLINPGVGDDLISNKTDQLLEIIPQSETIGINNSIIQVILFRVYFKNTQVLSWDKIIHVYEFNILYGNS